MPPDIPIDGSSAVAFEAAAFVVGLCGFLPYMSRETFNYLVCRLPPQLAAMCQWPEPHRSNKQPGGIK